MYYNKQREREVFQVKFNICLLIFKKKNNVYNGLFVQNIGPDFEGVWFSHHGGREVVRGDPGILGYPNISGFTL